MAEPAEQWQHRLPEHFRWLQPLHDNGTIVMSGPGNDGALGILVLRCEDAARAKDMAETDPLLTSRGSTVEVIAWQLHQIMGIGSFSPPNTSPTGTP